MSRLFSTLLAASAILVAAPVSAQMHEGSRGGGGVPHGGGFPHGGGGPAGGGAMPSRAGENGGRGAMPSGARGGPSGFHPQATQMEFHGRSFSSLNGDERTHWQTGEWRHLLHNGVFGWWWFLDDDWFFYPDAIYPYPTYISPLLTVQETPETAPNTPYWYYCANPPGYYPYVEACPVGWQTVPALPADAPPNAPPPPPGP